MRSPLIRLAIALASALVILVLPSSANARVDVRMPLPAPGLGSTVFTHAVLRGSPAQRATLPKRLDLDVVGAKTLPRSVRAIYATRRVDTASKTTYTLLIVLINRDMGTTWKFGPRAKGEDVRFAEDPPIEAFSSVRLSFRRAHTNIPSGAFPGFGSSEVDFDGEVSQNDDVYIGSSNFVTDPKAGFTTPKGNSVFAPEVRDRSLVLGEISNGRAFNWSLGGDANRKALFHSILNIGRFELRSLVDVLETSSGLDLNRNGAIAGRVPPGTEWPH